VKSVRAQASVLDPTRPTEGSCVAFLQFENGAAASLVYSGYDYFDSDEWHYWINERGAPKEAAHGAARKRSCKRRMKRACAQRSMPTAHHRLSASNQPISD